MKRESQWYTAVLSAAQQRGEVYQEALDIPTSNTLRSILSALAAQNRRALVVGGAVRDALQRLAPKDFDIEVYNATFSELAEILAGYGRVDLVGKSFGVIKFTDSEGNDYDFSVPRRDNKTGIGHKDFAISFDPTLSPKEAAARRDFTFNALAYDLLSQELHDYYGGRQDLESKILRHTSPAFSEDPLRVLRGMQFAARMGLTIAPETAEMAQGMAVHYPSLAKERVAEEWMKLAIRGRYPGSAIRYLQLTGWIAHYPEIENIVGVPQEEEWHPEGPVDVHTALVMDAAARIADRDGIQGEDRAVLIFAALGHDFAKSLPEKGGTTIQREKDGRMRWTAYGHEEASGPLAEQFLQSIGIKNEIIQRVRPIIEKHLEHIRFKPVTNSPKSVRQLAATLHPGTIEELARLMESDASGRPPLPQHMPEQAQRMLDMARKEGVNLGRPTPLIQGRDVMPYYGGRGGPHIGAVTSAAYKAQLNGAINTPEEAALWLKNHLKTKTALVRGEDVLPYFEGRPGPHVGEVVNAAWEAQRNNAFTDSEGAKRWLEQYMTLKANV